MKNLSINYIFLLIFFFISGFIKGQSIFLDNSFGNSGLAVKDIYYSDKCYDAAIQSDGKIVIVGVTDTSQSSEEKFLISRFTEDGFPDSTFSDDGFDSLRVFGAHDKAYGIIIQQDGKILVVGSSIGSSAGHPMCIIRYNVDGTLDSTFDVDGIATFIIGNSTTQGNSVDVNSSGKIIVAGSAYYSDWEAVLIQLNSDGSPDLNFGDSGVVHTSLPNRQFGREVRYQPNGKIVFGGDYDDAIGIYLGYFIYRYNSDGTLDSTFNGNGIVTDTIMNLYNMMLLPNDDIIIAGRSPYNGRLHCTLVRYQSNGIIDSNFGNSGFAITQHGSIGSYINSVKLQPDGKILAAFGESVSNFNLMRYNNDGTIDTSFGINGFIHTTILGLADYPVFVGIQPSGKIVMAGGSAAYPESDISLVRYGYNVNTDVETMVPSISGVSVFPNPLVNQSEFLFHNPGNSEIEFTLYDITGQIVMKEFHSGTQITIGKGDSPAGIYIYKISDKVNGESVSGKLIIE